MANNAKTYVGTSTDIKPYIYVNSGDFFYESDTEVMYQWNGTSWMQFIVLQDLITGGTYSSVTNKITFTKYNGRHIYVSGITAGGGGSVFTGGTVTGPTTFLNGLSANTISATTYQNLPINNFLTGGTFNSGTNTLNLVNYTGGTVSITGFTSGSGGTSNLQYYISGSTPAGTIHSGDRWFDTSSGYELVYINDGNSSQWVQPNTNGQITINNVTGGTSTSGNYLSLSGGTVTGGTIFTAGLSANTISATTYQNLPGTSFTNCITTLFVTNISGCSPVNIVSPLNVTNGLSITGNTVFSGGLTANTVSATTYYNLPIDVTVTGGTYSSGTATFRNNTGGTFNVTGFYTGNGITQGITGVTGNNGLSANTTNNVTTIGFSGGTIPNSVNFTNGLTANTISATTYQNLPVDIKVTGGTYSAGTATFTNNTGGTFSVTGFSTGNSVTQGITGITGNNGLSASTTNNVTTIGFSGGTIPNSTNFTGGLSANTISATTYVNLPTDIRTTGATYSNNTFTFTNNTGGTYSVLFNTVTGLTINGGLTVTGNTSLQGLTATTISATTYVNLPTDVRVTGGTYSAGTATFTNNTGGTFSVTGFSTGSSVTQGVTGVTGNNGLSASTSGNVTTIGFSGGTIPNSVNFTNGLSANTISATTYQNLPTDVRTTGASYSNNTFTFTNNTGGTYSVLFNTVTGLTINGGLTVTGNTSLQALTATTISATSYSNLTAAGSDTQVQFNKSGAFSGNSTFYWDYTNYNLNFGLSNSIQSSQYSSLLGSFLSTLTGTSSSSIVGGSLNSIKKVFPSSLNGYNGIFAGTSNSIYDSVNFANTQFNFIGGGSSNLIYDGVNNTILGGSTNTNRSIGYSAIVAGNNNNTSTYSNVIILGGTGITATQDYTTYLQNLNINTPPLVDNTLTQVLVRDGSTGNVKYRSVSTLFTGGTVTGMTINGNNTTTGTTFLGNGTFTKAGNANGDILLDNNSTDTPGVLFYYANNSNYGVDSWNGSYDVLSGQLLRFTNKLNESGGAVKMAIDTSGNLAVGGFIKVNAWRAGQVINDIMLSNTEVTISTTTIATSTSDTDFLTYSYTPLSSTSYISIHYHLASFSFEGGTGNDSYFSRIKVDGTEITYSRQSTVNGNRTGVLFPLTGRYTNSNTTAKSIVVACRRDSADDNITIVNSATSMWLRITEIAR